MSKKESATYEVLATESAGEKSLWKLQRTTFSDGATALGLRRFIIKADGKEQVTTMGFSLKEDDSFEDSIQAIVKLLKSTKAHGQKPQPSEEFVLMHKRGLPLGLVDWKGSPLKGIRRVFPDSDTAKRFRSSKCPTALQGDFRVKKFT